MSDLNEVRVFAMVAELQGFSAAARALGMPKSTVSRAVSRLEERLGIRLVQRSTRRVSLTDAGRAYQAHCRRALAEIEAAENAVDELRASPRGLLRVTSSFTFGTVVLAPLLGAFAEAYPDIRVELQITTREVDQINESVDVAIRAGSLQDSSLVARHLGDAAHHLYASPRYLSRRGAPDSPEALPHHDLVDKLQTLGERREWVLTGPGGEERPVTFIPRITLNDPVAAWEAALGGAGIAALPDGLCAPDAAAGRLVRLLPEWAMPARSIYAVFASRRGLAPKVRAFVDFLTRALEARADILDHRSTGGTENSRRHA